MKMNVGEVGCEGVDSSELAKHGVQCWDFVNTVMNGLLP
jgi:hypothetical protein